MNDERNGLTIGQLARAAEVGVETIRYYEKRGLLAEPRRAPSGYRRYSPDALRRVQFIRRAKDLGFTLREIGSLLSLRVDPRTSCADVRALARTKIADVDRRVHELLQVRAALERLAAQCRGRGPTSECPILDALEEEKS